MKAYIILIYISFAANLLAGGQTLEDYFQLAAENNPGLQASYKSFEAAMQKTAQVSGLPDPTLSFGYFVSPIETRIGPQQAKFSLTQMFPWFGSSKAQEEVFTLLAEAKYQAFLDERNRLYYQVAAAYYPLSELNQLTAIVEENLSILTSYKDITTIKFQNDQGRMVDVLRVDIMIQDATTNLAILKQKQKPLEVRFNRLINRADNTPVMIQDTQSIGAVPVNYRKDSLLVSNPLLAEMDLRIQASAASEQVVDKQGLPTFGVGLEYAIIGQRTDMAVENNGRDAFMPMVSMTLPIFRGKHNGAQAEAQLLQESYTLQKEAISNKLISAYEMAWFEVQQQIEYSALYEQQIQQSERTLQLLISAYSNSGQDFEEVLSMQQQILKYQKMKVKAITNYHIALAELDYITAKSN